MKHYPEENDGLWGRALTDPTPESEEKQRAGNQVKAWNAIWPQTPDGPEMHDLKGRVGYYEENRPEDVAKVQLATHKAGHTDLNISGGPTGIFGSPDHDGLLDLQRERGLNPDGKAFPGGETITDLKRSPWPKYASRNAQQPFDVAHAKTWQGQSQTPPKNQPSP